MSIPATVFHLEIAHSAVRHATTRPLRPVKKSLKAKFHYASWFEAGRRQVRSQIPLRYLVRPSFDPAPNLTSVTEFGFKQFL